MLYELLTGIQPYPAANRTSSEILKTIATQDPIRPSVALKSRREKIEQQFADHKISTDLDCVILRAIHRDRESRYPSVAALSADIANCLQQRPVAACKPGPSYRARKFFVRHKHAAIWTFLGILLLGTASWQVWYTLHRYQYALQKETAVRVKLQKDYDALKHAYAIKNSSGTDATENSPMLKQLQDKELVGVNNLTDAYRSSFSDAVRVWPGMSRSRQDLLDQSGRYLQDVEHFVGQDARAPGQLAAAWLGLANIEGNPKTINLRDRTRARYSIGQAQRLIAASPGVSTDLAAQVKLAVSQIETNQKP